MSGDPRFDQPLLDGIKHSPSDQEVSRLNGSKPAYAKPAESKMFLYVILGICVMLCFGQNYVFDFPQALEGALILDLEIKTIKISFLYAIYSLPNMIMSPITGYVIEIIGCNYSAVVYTGLTFFGQIIIYYGMYIGNYWWVLFGRGLYGIGGEGLTILQLTINELWFYGNFLSMSVAWCDIIAVFAILAGNFLSPELFTKTRNLSVSFFVMALMCFLSAICGILYFFYHNKYINRIDFVDNEEEEDEEDTVYDATIVSTAHKVKPIGDSTLNINNATTIGGDAEDDFNKNKIEFGFVSIRYYNATYWMLTVCFLFLANCYYQFTNIATEILEHRYGYNYEEANKLTVMPEIAFIVVSPFISKLVEVIGKKPLFLLICSIMFVLNYLVMYFMPIEKSMMLYGNLFVLGTCYSILTCALFSSVALSIPKAGVSMGYSILTLVENVGLSSLPFYFGWLSTDRTPSSYNNCILALIALSMASVCVCAALVLYDVKNTRLLTLPENSKKVKSLRKVIDSDFLERSLLSISKKTSSKSNDDSISDRSSPVIGQRFKQESKSD